MKCLNSDEMHIVSGGTAGEIFANVEEQALAIEREVVRNSTEIFKMAEPYIFQSGLIA